MSRDSNDNDYVGFAKKVLTIIQIEGEASNLEEPYEAMRIYEQICNAILEYVPNCPSF